VTLPRLEVDLAAIAHNTRVLVDRLSPKGIRVLGVGKATLGSAGVATAMLSGGVSGLGDSRVENLARLRGAEPTTRLTLIRSPMLSQVERVVQVADASLNTEAVVLDALSAAAVRQGRVHDVVLMVELGDLREGLAAADVVDLARTLRNRPGLRLTGLGTNLACQSGIVPDQGKMTELSRLAGDVEAACGHQLSVVSGGNSANLAWALAAEDVGRVDELRLGEAILLGTEPLYRRPVSGLRTDAFTLVAEVIEVQLKPAQAWGAVAEAAFGEPPPRTASGSVRQAILAIGRQDTDPDGLSLPPGLTLLGMSSDHLVVEVGDVDISVGDEVPMGVRYGALLRAMTSPFVTKLERAGRRPHTQVDPVGAQAS
jgi:predicted amino acid racemase